MTLDWNKPQDVAASVAVATVAARIAWGGFSQVWHYLSELWHSRTKSCVIDLGPFESIPRGARLRCVLVRHGTDQYLQTLAPAQDRFEGRLRNKLYDVKITGCEGSSYCFQTKLRVHQRLGTQFKFFFELNDIESAERLAEQGPFVEAYIARNDDPVKLWFLVKNFGTTRTVEGFQNNFWPAF